MSTARLADLLPALRIRPLRLLLAGQAVSFVGDALFPVALAFAVLDELDGTAGELGLVLAAQALPLALLVLVAGVWADRLPRQRLMLVSDFGRMVVQAVVAALLLAGAAELWMLVVLVALYGVFEAFFRPAAGGLIPQVAGPEHLQQANALMGLAQNVGTVLGPTLGGLLVVTVGPGAAIGVDAASFLVSAIFLIRMGSPPAQRAADAVSDFWAELRGGVAEVRRRRWMWTFMPALTAYHLIALPCVLALGPVIADRELGGAGSWAVIVTCFGAGTILGAIPRCACASSGRCSSARSASWPRPASRSSSASRLHRGDRGLRAAGGDRRQRRLHAVGDDARPRDPARVALARDLAGLVHHGRGDAARVRLRRRGRGRPRHAADDARGVADGAGAAVRGARGRRRAAPAFACRPAAAAA